MVQMALVRFLLLDRYRIHRSGSDTDVCLPLRRFWPIMSLWSWTIEGKRFGPMAIGWMPWAREFLLSEVRFLWFGELVLACIGPWIVFRLLDWLS